MRVMRETPPKPISRQLRDAIRASGYSQYRLSEETGVGKSVLSRFMAGKYNLSLANADRLAAFLGLRLTQDKRRRKKGR